MPVLPGIGSEWDDEMHAEARQHLDRAKRLLGDAPGGAQFRTLASTSAARALDALATKVDASAIVVGSTRRGALRRVSSSHTADRLMQGAQNPVLVAPRGIRDRDLAPLTAVGAYVPTLEGDLALRQAAALAQRSSTCTPWRPRVRVDPARQCPAIISERTVSTCRSPLPQPSRSCPADPQANVRVLEGNVVHALAALEEEDCQVLVCGSRGYGPVGRVLLGGVSSRFVRSAATPVLLVPKDVRDKEVFSPELRWVG